MSKLKQNAKYLNKLLIKFSKKNRDLAGFEFQRILVGQKITMEQMAKASIKEINESIQILSSCFQDIQPVLSFIPMMTIGALVEQGGDTDSAYEIVIPYFENILLNMIKKEARSVVKQIIDNSYPAFVSILSKSKIARRKIKERQLFMTTLKMTYNQFSGGSYL